MNEHWVAGHLSDSKDPKFYKPSEPKAPAGPHDGTITAGWICSVLLPVVGLIIGGILLGKDEKSGIGIMVTSVVASTLWVLMFAMIA